MTVDELPDGMCSTSKAAERAGVTYRQLDHWVSTGLIAPTFRAGPSGLGAVRGWTDDDVEAARRVGARLAWGMTLDAAFRLTDPPVPPPHTPGTGRLMTGRADRARPIPDPVTDVHL